MRWRCLLGFVSLLVVFGSVIRSGPEPIGWVPYSSELIARHAADGKPTAVLYFARWTLSADPKGGLLTPAVTRELADAGYTIMLADLTDPPGQTFGKLSSQGITALPVLFLYDPVDSGAPASFEGGTAESEIIAHLQRIGR